MLIAPTRVIICFGHFNLTQA